MKRALIIFVCIIVICACSDKEYIHRFADIKYTGKGIPHPEIEINGFYVKSDKINDMTIDSLNTGVIVFYKDGTFVQSLLRDSEYSLQNNKQINFSEEIVKWGRKQQHWGQVYGLYKIRNDTIHVTTYTRYWWSTNIDKFCFKIIDSKHIILYLYERPDLKPNNFLSKEVNEKYTFVPADSIPVPDNEYWKKKKWFWESESDWKHYMGD